MAKEVRCRIDIEENSECKRCCAYCKDSCNKKCIFTKRNVDCKKHEVHKITKSKSMELAKEGLEIRKHLMIKAKSPYIGVYYENNEFRVCVEEELKEKDNIVVLLDVQHQDTIKDMALAIWKVINSLFEQ